MSSMIFLSFTLLLFQWGGKVKEKRSFLFYGKVDKNKVKEGTSIRRLSGRKGNKKDVNNIISLLNGIL